MGIIKFTTSFLLMGYLHWIVDFPIWLSALLVCIFIIPPISFYTNMFLILIYHFVSIFIHLYTVVFAFKIAWRKGILSLFLPVFAEIYWFVIEAINKGYKNSIFCKVILLYIFGAFLAYFSPLIIKMFIKEKA